MLLNKPVTALALGFLLLVGIVTPVGILVWSLGSDSSPDAVVFALMIIPLLSVGLIVLVLKRSHILHKKSALEKLIDPKQPHMIKFQECQDLLTSSEGINLYYQHAYRETELSYWVHIPKWIMDMKDGGHNVRRCLDIGCAYGTLAVYCRNLIGCEVYATDMMSTYMSQKMAKENNITFFEHNIELDEFPWVKDTKFDIVIFTEILEHLNLYPVPTLRKIRSLLSENGRLFLSTPDSASWGITTKYYSSLAEIPISKTEGQKLVDDHVWHYSRDELLYVLEESGFSIEKIEHSPGVAGKHFNLCLRKDPDFVPEQHVSWKTHKQPPKKA